MKQERDVTWGVVNTCPLSKDLVGWVFTLDVKVKSIWSD